KDGNTPLHVAVRTNSIEMVRTLLELGADLEAKDKDGRDPIAIAKFSNPDVYRWLVLRDKGEDIPITQDDDLISPSTAVCDLFSCSIFCNRRGK
ncbi:ankyrin repeat domain-containing protein, partial [Wolbachia endosymbiont of Nasonia vitripennis]